LSSKTDLDSRLLRASQHLALGAVAVVGLVYRSVHDSL
jgi:hypothetical protein